MRIKHGLLFLAVACATVATQASAMEAQPTRLSVWTHSEAIGGEEFLAANEGIVDYLATLRRPTKPLQRILYDCMAKSRAIAPTVVNINGTNPNTAYVQVRMVYELSGCTEHQNAR